jgi:hypothetical protein
MYLLIGQFGIEFQKYEILYTGLMTGKILVESINKYQSKILMLMMRGKSK